MRIIALVIGSLLLILGVGTYLKVSKEWRVAIDPVVIEEATGDFQIELTPTFESKVGDWSRFTPLTAELLINGRSVWSTLETLPAGQVIRVNPGAVFVQGENELWVAFYSDLAASGDDFGIREISEDSGGDNAEALYERSSAESHAGLSRGVRLRIYRDDQVILDETIWSVTAVSPSGIVRLQINGQAAVAKDRPGQNERGSDELTGTPLDREPKLQGNLP